MLQFIKFVIIKLLFAMNIGNQIRTIRSSKSLSQQAVADKIGMNRVQYNRIETGKSEPTISILNRIAKVLDINIVNLFSDDKSYDINSYDQNIVNKVRLIQQLDEEQQKSIFTFIDLALSNKKLKDNLTNLIAS
jgi:transcriptional regulator with XRE-family HTH domain